MYKYGVNLRGWCENGINFQEMMENCVKITGNSVKITEV